MSLSKAPGKIVQQWNLNFQEYDQTKSKFDSLFETQVSIC